MDKNSESQTTAKSAEPSQQEQHKPLQEEKTTHFSEADLEKLIQNVFQKHYYNVTVITEEETSNIPALHTDPPVIPERARNIDTQQEENINKRGDEAKVELASQEEDNTLIAQEDRLKQAYQALKRRGYAFRDAH